MQWSKVRDGVWVFRDSCQVYAVEGPEGVLIVNAGTGLWLEHLDQLPEKPVALACTHYFRDHSAGAAVAARQGIPVYVPEYERAIFADPNQHYRQRETYIIYDNLWDLFVPIEPIPVAGVLQDYEITTLAGLSIEVLPLPGVTMTQVGLAISLPDGSRLAFTGETIAGPGKVARVAPFQYNYNDLPGAAQCYFSTRLLRERAFDNLFPSLGEPILTDTDGALALLQDNLRALVAVRPWESQVFGHVDQPSLQQVTEHVWWDKHSVANTWYIISKSGKALAIDYGYNSLFCSVWQGYPKPERRRALLHGLDGLKAQLGIEKIDVVLVSHFHDDHVCGIPVLQRLHGTQCWAAENFADLLAEPEAHCFPCDWPVAAQIDKRLPLDQEFTWEEYTFRLHPMNGHTRFSALIGFEADGKRFAHTGDQYFFYPDLNDFATNKRSQNHVYRNGALLDGYHISGEWMKAWKPDIVLQGHQAPFYTSEAFFRHMDGWKEDYAGLHQRIMLLGDEETHFNLDSWGGWIWPYRVHLAAIQPITVRATVRNPFPQAAQLTVRLVGPTDWQSEPVTLEAQARAEVACELTIHPTTSCRRQPIALELTSEGRPFGQVAEALVTIGEAQY